MQTTKKPQNKGFTLSSKDVEKLSNHAIYKAVLINGKWVTVFNKVTFH